jgi:putative transposase
LGDVHVPNVLQRDFHAMTPNQKWATDMTEFNVKGQKLYLSACMDLYNGEIVAQRMARRPVFDLVSCTLESALRWLDTAEGLIVHSDHDTETKPGLLTHRSPRRMSLLRPNKPQRKVTLVTQ